MATAKKTTARSGNPAKRAASKIATAKSWKGKDTSDLGQELELPSGNICMAKRIAPMELLSTGKLPDSLSQIVTKAINENKGLPPNALEEMSMDVDKIKELTDFMDTVTIECVLEPRILPKPNDGEEFDPDELYVHQVDMNDKIFIMQWAVGGSADLIQFRTGLSGGMAAIQASKDVAETA